MADGGSSDQTLEVANRFSVRTLQVPRGRARQMNAAARQARGEILWFLHADSDPPPDWREEMLGALSDPAVGGGAFRSRIDAPGVRYRFLDLWGWLRASWTGIFYGDQGIFVRRELFEHLGGFPDLPCLEDLDFSVQLKRQGKVRLLRCSLKTSARRWQTDGWGRTVLLHSQLALSHAFIRSRIQGITVILMAKTPIPGQVKTRLIGRLSAEEAAQVAEELLIETWNLVRKLKGNIRTIVSVAPEEGIPQMRRIFGEQAALMAQPEGDLGKRLFQIFEQQFSAGARGVLILGTDHPALPLDYLRKALHALEHQEDPVVLGPTEDGGYYLVGLRRPHPELFEQIPWSSAQVLECTLQRAKGAVLKVTLLPTWFDLDRPEDLERANLAGFAMGGSRRVE